MLIIRSFLNKRKVDGHFCNFLWGVDSFDGEGQVIFITDGVKLIECSVIVLHNLLLISAFLLIQINTIERGPYATLIGDKSIKIENSLQLLRWISTFIHIFKGFCERILTKANKNTIENTNRPRFYILL